MKPITATPYSVLTQEEEDISESTTRRLSRHKNLPSQSWLRIFLFTLAGAMGAMACTAIGYMAHQIPPELSSPHKTTTTSSQQRDHNQRPQTLHCGNSSTEATSLGCVFDLLTNNWMPKPCYDPYTDDEYRAWLLEPTRELGAFAFYRDKEAKRRVASEEELAHLVGERIYTTTENHLAHCTLLARRTHRLVDGKILAVAHNSLEHTMHCTKALLVALGGSGRPEQLPSDSASLIESEFVVSIVSCSVP